jgi:signal transduction histidine kinase
LLGGALGFLALHPYTMLIYGLYKEPGDLIRAGYGRVFHELASSFHPGMLSMGFPFAFLGAVAGLFFGFWLETRRQRLVLEKRLLAVETLRQLMMTISHHMLNAAQIVGGFAARDIRKEQDEDIRKHLEAIRNEAIRIEAVVESLKSLESVKSDRFSGPGGNAMVDIQEKLLEKMEELKRKQT